MYRKTKQDTRRKGLRGGGLVQHMFNICHDHAVGDYIQSQATIEENYKRAQQGNGVKHISRNDMMQKSGAKEQGGG